MVFHFSLDAVLRLRRTQERQAELNLQRANEQVNRILLELEILDEEAGCILSTQRSKPETSGAELYFDEQRHAVLAMRRAEAAQRLHEASRRQALAAAEFQVTWQKREALETLRGSEFETYVLEESRREQRAQDDLFLQRSGFRRTLPISLGKRCPSK